MDFQDKVILLTGASAGLGRELAIEMSKRGAILILCARSRPGLEETQKALSGKSALIVADLSRPELLPGLAQEALATFGRIDGFWANAGIAPCGPAEDLSPVDFDQVLRTNCLSAMGLTALLLPQLKRSPAALLAFTGSVFASLPFPYYAAYSASKAALKAYADSLRRELAGSPIQVFYGAPRAIRTRINADKADMAAATGMHLDEADFVAASLVKAVAAGRGRCTIGFQEGIFSRIAGAFPSMVDGALAKEGRKIKPFVEKSR